MTQIFPLKKSAVFKIVLSRGQKWVTKSFIVRALPCVAEQKNDKGVKSLDCDPKKIYYGIIASKKVGGAVMRNKAKRRLREALRHQADKCARPGNCYVFIARAALIQYPFQALINDLSWALQSLEKTKNI